MNGLCQKSHKTIYMQKRLLMKGGTCLIPREKDDCVEMWFLLCSQQFYVIFVVNITYILEFTFKKNSCINYWYIWFCSSNQVLRFPLYILIFFLFSVTLAIQVFKKFTVIFAALHSISILPVANFVFYKIIVFIFWL